MAEVRTRIAPSPSGYLHVGTARAALFNYLFAKKHGGDFILRIEDTDKDRSKIEYQDDLFSALRWLGIKPDEGPNEGGSFGPYRQSERGSHYRPIIERMVKEGSAFYCAHVSDDSADSPRIHWCGNREGGESHGVIRFKTPRNIRVSFKDMIRGEIGFESEDIGDFSIAKDLDTPLYNLASAIDDYEMKISHVLRGEDHIANTPKQLLIRGALSLPNPEYGHLPLILDKDRSKLSKRLSAVSVSEYRRAGYLPEALLNFIALLGWNPGTEQEIFSLEELVGAFSVEKIQKSGAVFDVVKLDWMNGEYIRRMALPELTDNLLPFFKEAGFDTDSIPREKLEAIVKLEQSRLKKLSEIGERVDFFFQKPAPTPEALKWKSMSDEEITESLDESLEILNSLKSESPTKEELEVLFMPIASKGGDKGRLLWPLRVALTGKKASPGPLEIISILGKDESIHRLVSAKAALKS